MSELEVFAGGDRATLKDLHVLNNAKNLIPDSFKAGGQAGGEIDWGAVVLAARSARRLGLDPVDNLRLLPVIRGRVFAMAEIWMVLARRHGWRVAVPVDTAERCVVEMLHPGHRRAPAFCVRDDRRGGLPARLRENKHDVPRLPARDGPGPGCHGRPAIELSRGDPGRRRAAVADLTYWPRRDTFGEIATRYAAVSVGCATADPAICARLAEAIDGLPGPGPADDLRTACRRRRASLTFAPTASPAGRRRPHGAPSLSRPSPGPKLPPTATR